MYSHRRKFSQKSVLESGVYVTAFASDKVWQIYYKTANLLIRYI